MGWALPKAILSWILFLAILFIFHNLPIWYTFWIIIIKVRLINNFFYRKCTLKTILGVFSLTVFESLQLHSFVVFLNLLCRSLSRLSSRAPTSWACRRPMSSCWKSSEPGAGQKGRQEWKGWAGWGYAHPLRTGETARRTTRRKMSEWRCRCRGWGWDIGLSRVEGKGKMHTPTQSEKKWNETHKVKKKAWNREKN